MRTMQHDSIMSFLRFFFPAMKHPSCHAWCCVPTVDGEFVLNQLSE